MLEKNSLWQGQQDSASGTRGYKFRTILCCNKKFTMARQERHCIRDERLQVEDSIML